MRDFEQNRLTCGWQVSIDFIRMEAPQPIWLASANPCNCISVGFFDKMLRFKLIKQEEAAVAGRPTNRCEYEPALIHPSQPWPPTTVEENWA